jgi:hypothetical protein
MGNQLYATVRLVTDIVYDITRPANYETLNRELVRQQLAKAGYRLAKLLDAIYGQWSVASGQWSVASGQWSVASGQWSVASGQ